MSDKWTEMEIKLAFQDKAVKDLSAALYAQQRRMDALEKTVKDLKDRLKAVQDAAEEDEPPRDPAVDDKPPHY